jgi:hypothetical protein
MRRVNTLLEAKLLFYIYTRYMLVRWTGVIIFFLLNLSNRRRRLSCENFVLDVDTWIVEPSKMQTRELCV